MNELKYSKSAFLLQSADSPIEWHLWNDNAFNKARVEDKPVLVDVGAAWCHWCHVMDEETYSDKEVIDLINSNFVAIKVDRDELPDIDRDLQNKVAFISNESGWPLTVFMTYDKKVFFGGTYFPLEDTYGRIGFKNLLKTIIKLWKDSREELLKIAEESSKINLYFKAKDTKMELIDDNIESIYKIYDNKNGGILESKKFPHPAIDQLFIAYSYYNNKKELLDKAVFTLKKMYYGGIFDQVGGGFHRYTVDDEWYIPHFEKLAIDNAELMLSYIEAYKLTNDYDLLDAIKQTYRFIISDLFNGDSFSNSIDADSEGIEGYYYTWTDKEFNEALEDESNDIYYRLFGLDNAKEVEGRKVLRRVISNEEFKKEHKIEELYSIRDKLLRYREANREKPFIDRNPYTYSNCRLAEALINLSHIIDIDLKPALSVLNRLSSSLGRRLDSSNDALIEDYASAILALLSGCEITGEERYKDLAVKLYDNIKDSSGYIIDSPNESQESLRLRALIKLSMILDEKPEIKLYESSPSFIAGILYNNLCYLKGTVHIVIVNENDGKAEALHKEALRLYHPFKLVEIIDSSNVDSLPSYMRSMLNYKNDQSRAFVCIGNKCSMPITSTDKLKEYIKSKSI